MDALGSVRKDDLVQRLGDAGAAFWDVFSISRGGVELTYLTEANPVDTHPLVLVDTSTAFFTSINGLYEAVLIGGEAVLESSDRRAAYYRARDKTLERQARDALADILGADTRVFTSVFETADCTYDHDVVLLSDGDLFVAEAKASPPREPFRNMNKGFVRVQRAFRSDSGIQSAFDQGDRLRSQLAAGQAVTLFDASGAPLTTLTSSSVREVFTICVTRDDFGPLASDLSLLLDRSDPSSPFPWAVPILSLQSMAMGWNYLGLDGSAFAAFLRSRRPLHGKVLAWDELDVVGFFIKHGGLHWLTDGKADIVQLNSHYADVFDQINAAVHLSGPRVTVEVTAPVLGDMRTMLGEALAQLAAAGPNDPCPCGSGKKVKKCHGKPR